MMDGTAPPPARSSQGSLPRLRARITLIFTVVVLAACLVSAALLISRATEERKAIEHQAKDAANILSFNFDQEVTAVNYLLKGLSKSPAVTSGNAKATYDQFKATSVPEGSWLNLNDLERQIVNTLRPFGTPLPMHKDFVNYQEQLNRIRERHWTVSGRMLGLVKGSVVVALSLRLDDAQGQMTGFITTVLPEARLGELLAGQVVPSGWRKGLYDRKFQPIVVEADGRTVTDIAIPKKLNALLNDANPDRALDGAIHGVDERGMPVYVAYRHSGTTNWTTVVTVPLAKLQAPVLGALWQITGPGVLLMLAGVLAALFTARQVEKPLHTMTNRLGILSDQVLSYRRQRRQARRLLQGTLDALSAHIAILDASGNVIAVNRAWHRFAENNHYATAGHGIGLNYVDVCRSATHDDPEAQLVAGGLLALLSGERTEFGTEYACGARWFLLRAARFTHDGAVHVVVAHEDVTDVTVARNEVRTLSGDLLHLQDEERQRIGVELHDSTTQHLTAAGLSLARAQLMTSDPLGVAAALSSAGRSIDEAQREIRTLSFLLYPPSLERDGLSLTLRDFVHGFGRRTGLVALVRIDPSIDAADENVCRATLRVTQEALSNIRRHAQADRISVDVHIDGARLRLRITDNGLGLPTTQSTVRPQLGVGIPGMKARVRQLGGELSVTGGRRGVIVRAVMPLASLADGGALQCRGARIEPPSGSAPMAGREPSR